MSTTTTTPNRYHPAVDVTRMSPFHSDRGGVRPTLIVVHATAGHNRPGIADLVGLGGWFCNPSAQVSSHVATDNEGNSARFVPDERKAWHCMAYNRMSLGIEQVAPGDGTEITRDMYRETARWIAQWSKKYGIPIREAQVDNGRILRSGVIRHSSLGALGGGHADPGRYDMHAMLSLARFYAGKI
jgi:N-acetyl-anhydromuramyl-L-alanine amidase AmpD